VADAKCLFVRPVSRVGKIKFLDGEWSAGYMLRCYRSDSL